MANCSEEKALAAVISQARQWSSCDFTRYNPGTLGRRVARRMIDVHCRNVAEYQQYLEGHPEEYPRLMTALTIKVSSFFRDPEVFSFLASVALPQIVARRRQSREPLVLRAWSAACACGEEPYSLAIQIAEYLRRPETRPLRVTILGTDLDPNALARAAAGIYGEEALKEIPADLRDRYFLLAPKKEPPAWQVTPALRETVSFASFDLTTQTRLAPASGIFADYDLILCRNMLIYCQHSLKVEIMKRLHACLKPHGLLVLGRSESLPDELEGEFFPVNLRYRVFGRGS